MEGKGNTYTATHELKKHKNSSFYEANHLKKGAYLYRAGEIPDFVVYVESGILRHIIIDSSENEKILRLYKEEDFIEACQSFNEQKPVNYSI